ncbi:MAG: serine/threonine-protein kinase, partial [Planctomycetota bacterium]
MMDAAQGTQLTNLVAGLIDEYNAAVERGEQVDITAIADRHPEFATEIKAALELVRSLDNLDDADLQGDAPHREQHRLKTIGDFQLIREIGRGGMGVVYEAEQISMGRIVALKVLPFAAVMDEKAITRFKNEARAAGTLHHENIVPVHAVGNDRGVYYYAMALIDGLTLARVIDELKQRVVDGGRLHDADLLVDQVVSRRSDGRRGGEGGGSRPSDPTTDFVGGPLASSDEAAQETKRLVQAALSTRQSYFGKSFYDQVARIGHQTANALHHAHEHGIVHRDIKPGNLMVDPSDKVWVTDFGLARIESDAGMTMTGDILGTLRYMAPEQALAKRIVVDHRADIYSLGATLYELLTLRPVFDAASRDELLKQLAFEEPKPIRQIHPA